jgi:ATP-dependent helicase/nuclease subunit A
MNWSRNVGWRKGNNVSMNEQATIPAGEINWTGAQRESITCLDGNLVVSASAGSGKTAVLTERVVNLVELQGSDPDRGCRLDSMLIITFTEKAARQMRDRIEERIREILEQDPDNRRLIQALDDLPNAWIMTIDAFCRRVVVENFHVEGLSADPRLIDSAEHHEMELGVLQKLLNQWADHEDRYKELRELTGIHARGTDGLIRETRDLMHFVESLDRPDHWVESAMQILRQDLEAEKFQDLARFDEFKRAIQQFAAQLYDTLLYVTSAAANAGADPVVLQRWISLAEKFALQVRSPGYDHDSIRQFLINEMNPVFLKLTNKTVCGAALYENDAFKKQMLEPVRALFQKGLVRNWFLTGSRECLEAERFAAAHGIRVLKMVKEAVHDLRDLKMKRNVATFQDIARTAFLILSDPPAREQPSPTAGHYRDKFRYILVDEYQDTSPLQDAIIRLVSGSTGMPGEPGGNRFLVGDYKQSIYRFRHADPRLFMEKLDGTTGGPDEKEPFKTRRLAENFRSRKGLIDFINACFVRFLDRDLGDVDYAKGEQLKSVVQDPDRMHPLCVEAHWLPKTDEQDEPAEHNKDDTGEQLEYIEAQAAWIANRIREMTMPGSEQVQVSGHDGNLRAAQPGDCAILVRALNQELPIWIHALEYAGLRVASPGVNPLFTTMELTDLVNTLKIVDNPVQDIPLSAVMRSPVGKFSDEELFRISLAAPSDNFADSIFMACGRDLQYVDKNIENNGVIKTEKDILPRELVDKLRTFMDLLDSWRSFSIHQSPSALLEQVLEHTGYEVYLMGLSRPDERLRNLDYLRRLIRQLENSEAGFNPLRSILNLLERAEEDQAGPGEMPEKVQEDTQSVRLLTIHKSKGLEYPIVFLPRLERRFWNRSPGRILMDRQQGISLEGIDLENRLVWKPLSLQKMALDQMDMNRAEELRVLYVAMTRAQQRLVLCGQFSHPAETVESWKIHRLEKNRAGPVLLRRHCSSTAQMIGPVIENILCGRIQGVDIHSLTRVIHDELPRIKPMENRDRIREQLADTISGPQHWKGLIRHLDEKVSSHEISTDAKSGAGGRIRLLPPHDPYLSLTRTEVKKTVTGFKKNTAPDQGLGEKQYESDQFIEPEMARPFYVDSGTLAERKPAWLRGDRATVKDKPSAIETMRRGTLTHELLAGLDLSRALDTHDLRAQLSGMIEAGRINLRGETADEITALIDLESIAWFFTTDLGEKMIRGAARVSRELPFTLSRPIIDYARDFEAAIDHPNERIILQGMIDALVADADHVDLIDYKTDLISEKSQLEKKIETYRGQILHYSRAIQTAWQTASVTPYLAFLDCRKIVRVDDED